MWNILEALELCRTYNNILSEHNAHIALTGSVLFKGGSTKDLDLIVYPRKTSAKVILPREICNLLKLVFVEDRTLQHAKYTDGDEKMVIFAKTVDNRRIDLFFLK